MFGIKTPQHAPNPFDCDDESDKKPTLNRERRTSAEPSAMVQDSRAMLFEDDEVRASGYKVSYASRNKYKNDFVDSGGVENQDVQELEHYAAYKSEETTKTVNNALKIAENIREDATKTMLTLHNQGEQITRTHTAAADIEQDLSRGEKLVGSLGGIFSRTWKPKKGHKITGPVIKRDDATLRKDSHFKQREKLGLTPTSANGAHHARTPPREPTNAMQKVEYEKKKQDDALSELSDILEELKEMAVDMGSEIGGHINALNPLDDDVEELTTRVKGVNQRTRRLLGK